MSIEYGIKSIEFIKGEVSQLDIFEVLNWAVLGRSIKIGQSRGLLCR